MWRNTIFAPGSSLFVEAEGPNSGAAPLRGQVAPLFHRVERSYGAFARTFTLPPKVDASKVSAQYQAGVLTVRLPLREDAKPNRIKIEVAA